MKIEMVKRALSTEDRKRTAGGQPPKYNFPTLELDGAAMECRHLVDGKEVKKIRSALGQYKLRSGRKFHSETETTAKYGLTLVIWRIA